jgi:predicted GNAT superfamily acetyltransferase
MELRDLTTIDDFRHVVGLEKLIWGVDYEDVVSVPILAVTVKRGGVLIGAFADGRLVGFVYSLAGIKEGKPTQWSHMLGVLDEYRNSGLGRRLKLAQRLRALDLGCDLIEWTFDPLQTTNAHLNVARLGVVVEEYAINVYGESTSPLHRGTPTDRFVAEWWIRRPHVERRIEPKGPLVVRSHEAAQAPSVNRSSSVERRRGGGVWPRCESYDLTRTERRLSVEVPAGFTLMQQQAPDIALEWRMATREIFTTYFSRGYRAVDFTLDEERGRGRYLLALQEPA